MSAQPGLIIGHSRMYECMLDLQAHNLASTLNTSLFISKIELLKCVCRKLHVTFFFSSFLADFDGVSPVIIRMTTVISILNVCAYLYLRAFLINWT